MLGQSRVVPSDLRLGSEIFLLALGCEVTYRIAILLRKIYMNTEKRLEESK